jgi:hypothetical protein
MSVATLPDFTPPARQRWESIPAEIRQDRLDDRRLQQLQVQQFIDRGVVQALAPGDLAAARHCAVVEALRPLKGPRSRHPRRLVVLRNSTGSRTLSFLSRRRSAASIAS